MHGKKLDNPIDEAFAEIHAVRELALVALAAVQAQAAGIIDPDPIKTALDRYKTGYGTDPDNAGEDAALRRSEEIVTHDLRSVQAIVRRLLENR